MEAVTHSKEELQHFAADLLKHLTARDTSATLVTLSGELGAGKTTFAQGLARALGVEEFVTSPTFVIEKVYLLEKQRFERLVHIDAYRLKSADELTALGWGEICADPQNLIVLEWPEKVSGLVPENAIRIRFDIEGDTRIISIDGQESSS